MCRYRVLKCAVAPSSSELSWETVKSSQVNWKPIVTPSTTRNARSGKLLSFSMLRIYAEYVEENNDEAGKLPQLSYLFCIVTQP